MYPVVVGGWFDVFDPIFFPAGFPRAPAARCGNPAGKNMGEKGRISAFGLDAVSAGVSTANDCGLVRASL
ncbi:hypothetical protein [Halosimplex amylolyticum]|uniref:hypothetical protein n=1 Tax=Halosimplex amylolyticum TaxID=3396616 RepID=UPI003F55421E